MNTKDLSNHTNGAGTPLIGQVLIHKIFIHGMNLTEQKRSCILSHFDYSKSSNIRAFSAMFPVVIISTKTNFAGKLFKFYRGRCQTL